MIKKLAVHICVFQPYNLSNILVLMAAWLVLWCIMVVLGIEKSKADQCNLMPVIHVLNHPGCLPKPIPSFACQGKCNSYVQVVPPLKYSGATQVGNAQKSSGYCQPSLL